MLDYVRKLDTVNGSRDIVREMGAEDAYIEYEKRFLCRLDVLCSSVVGIFFLCSLYFTFRLADCSYRQYFTVSSSKGFQRTFSTVVDQYSNPPPPRER